MIDKMTNPYLEYSLGQIPRILSCMDRNPLSETFGCCDRSYWLEKTRDFPDAVRQFGLQALAIVYSHEMPGNVYYKNKNLLSWIAAGLRFWAKIQHSDGSYDEFYPNERGWVGPTAFTTYSSVETFKLVRDELDELTIKQTLLAIKKSAYFISEGEAEEDHLANHHAMACLAVWKANSILCELSLSEKYEELLAGFLSYHNSSEGWSREYDGIDPGYLSATVSFLGKIYEENADVRLLEICKASIEMCSYFAYPNGFYAGSMGSRNTLHFYPHGFEVFAETVPLAQAVADKMLTALGEGKLVPPEIMSDRYMFYRVPEYLQSFLKYNRSGQKSVKVPYENDKLDMYFDECGIRVISTKSIYLIANLKKGGVIKIFTKKNGQLIYNDCGFVGRVKSGKLVSSQWIDKEHICKSRQNGFLVEGRLQVIPSNKIFNVPKLIVFRLILLLLGWQPNIAHSIKGWIRKILMLGSRPVPVSFKRVLSVDGRQVSIHDEINNPSLLKFTELYVGGEFFVRYVPQSRYFQSQELTTSMSEVSDAEINKLNSEGHIFRKHVIEI